MRRHDHTQTERGFPPINPPNCPSSPWSARTLIPGFSSSLSLGRFERVSCGTWIFTPLHPSLGQENHRPPPWRRPRRCPINTDLFPVHLLRSQKWDSLIISTSAASSVLLAWQAKAGCDLFSFPLPNFAGSGGSSLVRVPLRWWAGGMRWPLSVSPPGCSHRVAPTCGGRAAPPGAVTQGKLVTA